jgi:predicted transcriptional regulator
MNLGDRRTTSEVLQDIMSTGPATKSCIRFSVGLNYSQAQRYLSYLVTEGYLSMGIDENGRTIYEISARGRQLLGTLSELSGILDV